MYLEMSNASSSIKGIKQLDTDMYKIVCSVYTSDAMFIPTTTTSMCVDYSTFLSGEAVLNKVPIEGHSDGVLRSLRATPSPQEITKVLELTHGVYRMIYGNCHPQELSSCKSDGFKLVDGSTTNCCIICPANAIGFSKNTNFL